MEYQVIRRFYNGLYEAYIEKAENSFLVWATFKGSDIMNGKTLRGFYRLGNANNYFNKLTDKLDK